MPHSATCVIGSDQHFPFQARSLLPGLGFFLMAFLCVKYGLLNGWFMGVITTAFVICISERGHDWMGEGWWYNEIPFRAAGNMCL